MGQFSASILSLNLDPVANLFDCVLYVFHCNGLVVNLFVNIIVYVALWFCTGLPDGV